MNITVFIIGAFVISSTLFVTECNSEEKNYFYYGSRSSRDGSSFAFPDELGLPYNQQYHHHNHHQPNPYHQHFERNPQNGNRDFDNPYHGGSEKEKQVQIPLHFINELNQYNVSDLLLNYVDDYEEEKPVLQNRFGEEERSAAITPKPAACMPELTTVKIAASDDPTVLYIPSCTRIERCGGCCTHSLLSCQPKDTETVSYQVIKTQYTGGKKLKYIGKEIVLVERHTKCKCDCKVRPEDCKKFQEYRKSECRCACSNIDEEKKCYKYNDTKLWNPETCSCQCREELQCSTGYYFDVNECKCAPVLIRRRYIPEEREQKDYKAPQPFVTLH